MNYSARISMSLLCALIALAGSANSQGVITTVAGTDWVFAGGGKPAVNAPIGNVESVTIDRAGNPVFADPGNAVVLRVESNGLITVLAGNGLQQYSGDGGNALSAALNSPTDAAFDFKGNLYIADFGNNRIRKVAPDGTITTLAGTGAPGFSGDGGPAAKAALNSPLRIVADAAGVVYAVDSRNARIRRILPDGTISTYAGNGMVGSSGDGGPALQASLNGIEGIAIDAAGNLYVAEFSGHRIRRIDTRGVITTIAGDGQARFFGDGGPAIRASFDRPGGVAIDSTNNIYVSDTNNFRIRKIDSQGVVTTIAGSGKSGFSGDRSAASTATFEAIFGLAVDPKGVVFVADRDNFRLRQLSTGIVSTVAGNGSYRFFRDGTQAVNAFLYQPFGISLDLKGNLLIADTFNNRVRTVGANGSISTLAGNGSNQFSGDGGRAADAGLSGPASVTADRAGNLYIADTDNDRIRRIAADGTISTVAGNGKAAFSGDGAAADQAALNAPQQVAIDVSGNLYISDFQNNRIRRVKLDGKIETFAGNGSAAFSGDGAAATAAGLNGPSGLAFDASGNLYIADWGNARIRRVTPGGIISTVAGGGSRLVTSAASIVATEAALGRPLGITVDRGGTIYFSDARTHRVLAVSAAGMLSSVAGNGNPANAGDGGSSTRGSLNFPYGLAIDALGNLLIADSLNNRIRAVLSTTPTIQAAPASFTFSASSQGPRTDPQSLTMGASVPGLAYAAEVATASGGAWLQANVASGSLPASIQLSVDPSNLSAGTYRGTVTISGGVGAQNAVIPVSLNVAAALPTKLGVGSQALTFSFLQGGSGSTQTLSITNQGGGSLRFTASVASEPGASWLTVSPASGQATPVQPSSISLQADPGKLSPGTYSATVSIAGNTGEPIKVPVRMTINSATQSILLSQTGLDFTVVSKGGSPLSQSFAVLNAGQGDLSWAVKASTLSGPNGWLSVTPLSGSVSSAGPEIPLVKAVIDPTNLEPGEYYAQIQVSSTRASNSPQSVSVRVKVLPAGADPGPQVEPSGLIFTGVAGSNPGSQTVSIANLGGRALDYASGRVTTDGQNWLLQAPANATILPNQPSTLVVQPDFSQLAPGVYQGTVTLLFSGGAVRTINVNAAVAPAGAGTAGLPAKSNDRFATSTRSAVCGSNNLVIQFQSLSSNFTAVVGQATTIKARITDACGDTVTNVGGSAKVGFTNGDNALPLVHVGDGVWSGTWRPVRPSSGTVTLILTAFQSVGAANRNNQAELTGTVLNTGTSPLVTAGGVVNGASFAAGAPVAPGSLISIYGASLSDSTGQAPGLPLPQSFAGTQVRMGDIPLPILYSSPGQLNVQVPYDIPINTQFQIAVQRAGAISVPESLVVAPAQPGIFTLNQQGTGQGAIVKSDQVTLAQPGTPASAGDTVVIYCTGLGAVTPEVPAGTPASLTQLSRTVNPVSVLIGGQPARVDFAGLAPGYAGLYQVNAVVAQGTPSGNSVTVTVAVSGQVSPPATMAVR